MGNYLIHTDVLVQAKEIIFFLREKQRGEKAVTMVLAGDSMHRNALSKCYWMSVVFSLPSAWNGDDDRDEESAGLESVEVQLLCEI